MIDSLRYLLMIFYAPVRGMRGMRDRASLAPVALMAFLSQAAFNFALEKFGVTGVGGGLFSDVFRAGKVVAFVAIIVVPILTLVANTLDRRGSFRVVITQEYAPLAASVFYSLLAANIFTILFGAFLHYTGIQAQYVAFSIQNADQVRSKLPPGAQYDEMVTNPVWVTYNLFRSFQLILFAIGAIIGVKDTFRMTAMRAFAVTMVGGLASQLFIPIVLHLFSGVLGSPFLLILLFFLLRGYVVDIMGSHRAKAAFKQNLESATLNPADASAHYNLGLIHQSRGELDEAKARFERALEIDPEEIDAAYQLGRIARQQKRYGDAIQSFEHVVARNQAHSQHEVWREVAATYIAAGQFEDARTALDQFLEHRPSDPEGLYLMGRAHAGLGHKREATSLMQACIEAVKTAPAYKYRSSKRWLNEAQQFIKSSQ
jgi:tetratricopeptide (TPR) repeat protein